MIAYLAAGGLDFELGDGKINYAPETVIETYYNMRLRKGIFVTLDLQMIADPGYNRDRGPAFFAGLAGSAAGLVIGYGVERRIRAGRKPGDTHLSGETPL